MNRQTDALAYFEMKQALSHIHSLAQEEGINAKRLITEYASAALDKVHKHESLTYTHSTTFTYSDLRRFGVSRTQAVIAETWPVSKQEKLIDATREYAYKVERAKTALYGVFADLRKNE